MGLPNNAAQFEQRIPIGPGTGIDTKYNKQLVLHVPFWLYKCLHVYVHSERASERRKRAQGGDTPNQHLFLSRNGTPMYETKAERAQFNEQMTLRHSKTGQAVRMFMTERVIPFIRERHDQRFTYRFHDTRATFGMNMTDHQLSLVSNGQITLHEAREFVKVRMGHESSAVTDRYLQFRKRLHFVRHAQQGYDQHLQELVGSALSGGA